MIFSIRGMFPLLTIAIILSCFSCKDEVEPISSEKGMVSFAFLKELNPMLTADAIGVIDEQTGVIEIDIPQGDIDLSSMIATFQIKGFSSIAIGSKFQESGETRNNFFEPKIYKITALDGSAITYEVRVSYIKSTFCELFSIKLEKKNNVALETDFTGVISSDKVASFVLPDGTDRSELVMSYETSKMSKIYINSIEQESGKSSVDFTTPQVIRVMAEDGVTYKEYTVNVLLAQFKSFVITSASDIPASFALDSIRNLTLKGAAINNDLLTTLAQRIGSTLKIVGNIRLEETPVTTLVGFADNLNWQGGFEFINNAQLTNDGLAPFASKTEIKGDLVLSGFATSVWIDNFKKLERVGGSFRTINSNFYNGNEYPALTYVGGDFEVNGVPSGPWTFSSMKLTYIGGSFIVNNYYNLNTFTGLDKMIHIGGNVTLTNNAKSGANSLTWEANGYKLINRYQRDGIISPTATITVTDKDGNPVDILSYGF